MRWIAVGCNAFQVFIHMFDTLKLYFLLFSAVKLRPKEGETYFDVVAVVDPVTRDAQRLAPLLLVCKQGCEQLQIPSFWNVCFLFDCAVTSGFLIVCLSFTMHLSVKILIRLHYTLTRSCQVLPRELLVSLF